MYSFAVHNISPDTPHTNWECPKTERDHIRVAFKENGRGYLIRDSVIYPPAHDIVKPLVEGPGNIHEWWETGDVDKRRNDSSKDEDEFGNKSADCSKEKKETDRIDNSRNEATVELDRTNGFEASSNEGKKFK